MYQMTRKWSRNMGVCTSALFRAWLWLVLWPRFNALWHGFSLFQSMWLCLGSVPKHAYFVIIGWCFGFYSKPGFSCFRFLPSMPVCLWCVSKGTEPNRIANKWVKQRNAVCSRHLLQEYCVWLGSKDARDASVQAVMWIPWFKQSCACLLWIKQSCV